MSSLSEGTCEIIELVLDLPTKITIATNNIFNDNWRAQTRIFENIEHFVKYIQTVDIRTIIVGRRTNQVFVLQLEREWKLYPDNLSNDAEIIALQAKLS